MNNYAQPKPSKFENQWLLLTDSCPKYNRSYQIYTKQHQQFFLYFLPTSFSPTLHRIDRNDNDTGKWKTHQINSLPRKIVPNPPFHSTHVKRTPTHSVPQVTATRTISIRICSFSLVPSLSCSIFSESWPESRLKIVIPHLSQGLRGRSFVGLWLVV